MIDEPSLVSLLKRMEDETLDFKSTAYDIRSEDSRLTFVKDVLCMANTPRDTSSFIVLGVKKHTDGRSDLVGIQSHPDDADLQSQFGSRVHPTPQFSYCPIEHQGRKLGIIEIPPIRIGPSVPTKDFSPSRR